MTMSQSRKLKITNFSHLAKYFVDTEYRCLSFGTSDDAYTIRLQHRTNGKTVAISLNRVGYLTGGEWHYSTYVESNHYPGTVTWDFIKDPMNLIRHMLISIKESKL